MTLEDKLNKIYCKWMHFDSKDGKPYIYWDEKGINSALKEAYNLGVGSTKELKEEKDTYHISPRQTKINFEEDDNVVGQI